MVSVADYKDGRLLVSALPRMLISQESLNNLQSQVSLPCKTSPESGKGNPPSTEYLETQGSPKPGKRLPSRLQIWSVPREVTPELTSLQNTSTMTLSLWAVVEQSTALQECCLLVNRLALDPRFPLLLPPPAHADSGFVRYLAAHETSTY